MLRKIGIGVYLTGIALIIMTALEKNPDSKGRGEAIIALLITTILIGSLFLTLDLILSDHMKGGICLGRLSPLEMGLFPEPVLFNPSSVKGEMRFDSVTEADRWLAGKLNAEITFIDVPTRYSWDICGGHKVVKFVDLEFKEHATFTGYQYGLVEMEVTRYFVPVNPDRCIEKWERTHPEARVIWHTWSSVVRRTVAIHLFDFGTDRRERMRIVLLFKREI